MNAQTGALYWSKYEIASGGYLSCMRYANGKYFLVGGTEQTPQTTQGKVVAVSSQTGNVIWQTPLLSYTFPGAGSSRRIYFISATEMHNGKMFITGQQRISLSNTVIPDMPVIVGINESGTTFLQQRVPLPFIGFSTSYQGSRIEYDTDDNIVLTCFNNGSGSSSNDPGLVILKMDSLGNTLFSKEYEIAGEGYMYAQELNETADSYVVFGGVYTSFTGAGVLKVDKNGLFEKCVGIQKPDIYYGAGTTNSYGNSDFRNGLHYFATAEMFVPTLEWNINQIIVDEELNTIADCSFLTELPVTVTDLGTQLEPLQLIPIAHTFTFLDGIIAEDLDLYIPCDSLSLELTQLTGCQSMIVAHTGGFESPTFHWSDGTSSYSDTLFTGSPDTVIVRVLDIRCCELTDTIVPVLSSSMTMSLPADTTLCLQPGMTFTLTPVVANSVSVVSYTWNDNSTGPALSVDASGTYWVEVSDSCATIRDSIQIEVLALPEIAGLADTSVCEGAFPVNLDPVVTAGASVLWNDGVATAERIIETTGIYTLQATNICGTTDTTVIVTQTDLPDVSLIAAIDSCLNDGESITLLPVLNNVTTISWSDGTTNTSLSVSQTGTYTVYGSNVCGTDSAWCSVVVREFPFLDLPATLDTCFEPGVGFSYTAQGSPGTYEWSSGSQTATELITQEGIYSCTLTNQCGSTTDSMEVRRLANLDLYVPDDSLQLCAQQISVNLLKIETNYDYELFRPWNGYPAGSTLNESGWYHIRAFNACGELWDSVYVDLQNEQAIYMPNSFTPNGDGINDVLELTGLNVSVSSLRIFNRWGQEVFHPEGSTEQETVTLWDGTYEGKPCPDGVYQFQVTYANCFGIPTQFTGHVNLLR